MDKKKKIIIIGIIALVLIIIGTTYAILTWTSNKINIGLNSACFTIDYTKGQDISGNLKLLNESDLINNNKFTIKEGIGISAVNIGIKSTCTIEGFGSIYLNITNISDAFTTGDSKGSLKYAVLNNNSTVTTPSSVTVSSLLNQSFDIVSSGSITSSDTITLITKHLSNTETYKYLVVIYVDNSLAGNSITSATFNGNISADAEQVSPTPEYCFTLSNKDETNKTASISGYNCYEENSNGYDVITNVVIPEKIDGYTITSIGEGAFCDYAKFSHTSNCQPQNSYGITSVIMPDTITTIEGFAFGSNEITYVRLSKSLTTLNSVCTEYYSICRVYGGGAFANNNISQIELPDSLTTIGASSFKDNKLLNIELPNSIINIGERAFEGNSLKKLAIPNSVKTIGFRAFLGNDLNWVLINSNSNLTSIESLAFSSSSETTYGGIVYNNNQNLKTIYNNSGKAFDWNSIVSLNSGTPFVTGTTTATDEYNAVTVTTGQPN